MTSFLCVDEYQVPEMQRTPLEDLVLQAKVSYDVLNAFVLKVHVLTL